ncbi:flexible cuticle protein 12-like [Phlebotomus argentipes]|uniref:flexible cuticle protein 12-like n=1 Tax=Phlebotomus argentipes TaxID=94469 RepID=UPI0028932E0F|nr:flexible cuticle protein 12-like [Phlebotomus argentipes]
MKAIIALALLVGVALAAPPRQVDADRNAVVLRYESDNIGVDGYRFAYETSNGLAQQEEAQLKNVGTEHEALVVRGSFSYVGPDGVTYVVNYVADENGFQPQGAHLPVA